MMEQDAEGLEAVEGFWLARPWLRSEGCPAAMDAAAGARGAPARQTLALVALYDEAGSRMGRRDGKAYTYRVRGEASRPAALPIGGYRLVLEGRLGIFPDGKTIRCKADGPDQRPVCIAAVQMDRVAFETSEGLMLSEWRAG